MGCSLFILGFKILADVHTIWQHMEPLKPRPLLGGDPVALLCCALFRSYWHKFPHLMENMCLQTSAWSANTLFVMPETLHYKTPTSVFRPTLSKHEIKSVTGMTARPWCLQHICNWVQFQVYLELLECFLLLLRSAFYQLKKNPNILNITKIS